MYFGVNNAKQNYDFFFFFFGTKQTEQLTGDIGFEDTSFKPTFKGLKNSTNSNFGNYKR